MKEQLAGYTFIGAAIAAAVAAIFTINGYLIAFASGLALACLASYLLWDIIEAKIFERTNMVHLFDGFELDGSRLSAIYRHKNGYVSTTAARVETLGGVGADRDKIERLIANVKAPFKLVLHVKMADAGKLLENLHTRKAMLEISLSRINSNGSGKATLKASRIRSEVSRIESEIKEMSGGSVPVEILYYIVTSAFADSRFKAEEMSRGQLRELIAGFDATFGTKSSQVSGIDLIRLMKFDVMQP